MNSNSNIQLLYLFKCAVCNRPSKYLYYGVKCCERCKHFFRRTILLLKEYKCKNAGHCDVEKDDAALCKRCRLNKCITVGMNPLRIRVKKFNGEQILAYVQRIKQQLAPKPSPPSAEIGTLLEQQYVLLINSINIEHKVRRIRFSETPVPEFFYKQCDSFEAIFARKLNLLELTRKFTTKQPHPPKAIFFEKIRKFGPFFIRPEELVKDLLLLFEIGKTFPFFERLYTNDKIALCSNIAMPLYVLCNGFYSVQQNSEVFCNPAGMKPIQKFKNSFYHEDPIAMGMGDKLLCKAIEPFRRLKLSTEEFVLIRAIIYSHMVSPGLSDQAQKLLFSEAEKYSSLLMSILQTNNGAAPGALRYVELMGLIEGLFNMGTKYRQLFTYISNVLDPNFDRVMPSVLAKICTKGPVESHQLLPY
ncbi:hypothetical protein niasHS_009080 [Heterodera schachtii]|uniref:Nuclear Hormone Receptor family n=1 Tax=Heterodera schachtii TaxID=97005 RepID=A0ABD2J9F6_HETSC